MQAKDILKNISNLSQAKVKIKIQNNSIMELFYSYKLKKKNKI